MTEEKRKEALRYIEAQLEDGYLDLGLHEQDELEIVKEAMDMLKIVDEWNKIPLNETLEKIWNKSDLNYNTYALKEQKPFYTGKRQKLIRLPSNSEDCVIDYDKERGMYRVSIFNEGHFWDEFWFDAYEDKEKYTQYVNFK